MKHPFLSVLAGAAALTGIVICVVRKKIHRSC